MIVNSRRPLVALTALLLTAGCVVGPNFKSPAAPAVAGYTAYPLPATTVATPGRADPAGARQQPQSEGG
jgi:hypothetical protein